jgi:hypothetical protein
VLFSSSFRTQALSLEHKWTTPGWLRSALVALFVCLAVYMGMEEDG